jgi:predicted DCC family thiol-disulfide oxidoreductase YuxK
LSKLVLAYDADCGPCTSFKHFVHFIDTQRQVDFISLIEADETGLLDKIPRSARHASFHLVFPDGEILSGSSAIPSLIELLPHGKTISRVITSTPGGPGSIAFVYAWLARLHDRGSCRYHGSLTRSTGNLAEPVSGGPLTPKFPVSKYLSIGLLGGFLGSLAMGVVVPLPDALCVRFATGMMGQSPSTYTLAWALHVLTGVTLGGAFSVLASRIRLEVRRPMARSVFLGLSSGVLIWAGFFIPSIAIFAPSVITDALLEASFAAHVLFGLILGATFGVFLSQKGRER